MLTRLLFETPWWLPTVAIGVGLFVWFTGNRRQERKVMLSGLGMAGLGIAILLISIAVDTDRELAVKRTRQLVASTADHDWQKFQSLVDPETTIYGLKGPQQITDAIRSGAERVNLTSARITGMEVEQNATFITVTIRVLSEQFGGTAAASDWQMQFQNFGKGFVLYNVRALPTGQVNDEMIRARIQRMLTQPN